MIPADRDKRKLHPVLQVKLERLEDAMRAVGHPVFMTEGWRSEARQSQLYDQGRKTPGPIVTDARAGESLHNLGLAADYAFSKEPPYSEKHPWHYLGATAKVLGLGWGGEWRKPDRPHVELREVVI